MSRIAVVGRILWGDLQKWAREWWERHGDDVKFTAGFLLVMALMVAWCMAGIAVLSNHCTEESPPTAGAVAVAFLPITAMVALIALMLLIVVLWAICSTVGYSVSVCQRSKVVE